MVVLPVAWNGKEPLMDGNLQEYKGCRFADWNGMMSYEL